MPLRTLPRYLLTGRLLQIVAYLPQFARLYWALFRDRRVPLLARAFVVLVALYAVWPLDLIPIWIPIAGLIDDVFVVLGGLWLFVRLCPPAVVREHVQRISNRPRGAA